jgi:hypothetical protein
MIASVHIADLGAGSALGILRRQPKPGSIPGLRQANIGLAAPLSSSTLPPLRIGRVGLIAFWDDEDSVDTFVRDDPLAARFAGGWEIRLEPLRMHGSWPGVPADLPQDRTTDYTGAAAVLTLGRLKLPQAPRFLRTSAKAEGAVVGADGLVWATGLARPPFVATCSLWESTKDLSTYAYGRREPAHAEAIAAQDSKDFHHQSAFIRFRPVSSRGNLGGRNPLREFAVPHGDPTAESPEPG